MPQGTASNLFDATSGRNDFASGSFVPPVLDSVPPTKAVQSLPQEEATPTQEKLRFISRDITAFATSLITHVAIILLLALVPIINHIAGPLVIQAVIPEEVADIDVSELAYSDAVTQRIGSNSIGEIDAALSTAPIVSDVSELPIDIAISTIPTSNTVLNVDRAVGATQSSQSVRGNTGYGVSGTEGAIDRITQEIIKSVEQRPTLVVWLFDASISLSRRREEVRARFDRVYKEIGAISAGKHFGHGDEPLLTSIYSYGSSVRSMLDKPTADPKVIQKVVGNIDVDPSGIEMTFSAINAAAEKFRDLRITKDKVPERNVMIIAVTDERGNDSDKMDHTIELCKSYGMPVYVLGVPAPFGRSYTYIKYANPDPKNNGQGVWGQIDQGPETFMLERPLLGYGQNNFDEVLVDSGFGPYCLSRVCYETGGIFFTIHPNRIYDRDVEVAETETYAAHLQHFFDPAVMEPYRPDYLSADDYDKMLVKHPFRAALVDASQMDAVEVLRDPVTQFYKHDAFDLEAEINKSLDVSSQISTGLDSLCQSLKRGEAHRSSESSPRWLASYDLASATANAERIRNEIYQKKLLELKRGIKFHYAESNTWVLIPTSDCSQDPQLQKEADAVVLTLEQIVRDHAHTPWAYLAQRELQRPIGWSWKEEQMQITVTRGSGNGGSSADPRGRSKPNNIPKF